MKSYLVLLPIFLLSLLQGAILPLNLILLVVLIWAAVRPVKQGLWVAFWSGLFLDLAKGTLLGFSSLFFLMVATILVLYSHRFDPTHPAFLATFVFLTSTTYSLISKRPWVVEGLILVALSFLARPLIRFYQEGISREKLKLKV
jgi:rod shape-determining protein MreD